MHKFFNMITHLYINIIIAVEVLLPRYHGIHNRRPIIIITYTTKGTIQRTRRKHSIGTLKNQKCHQQQRMQMHAKARPTRHEATRKEALRTPYLRPRCHRCNTMLHRHREFRIRHHHMFHTKLDNRLDQRDQRFHCWKNIRWRGLAPREPLQILCFQLSKGACHRFCCQHQCHLHSMLLHHRLARHIQCLSHRQVSEVSLDSLAKQAIQKGNAISKAALTSTRSACAAAAPQACRIRDTTSNRTG